MGIEFLNKRLGKVLEKQGLRRLKVFDERGVDFFSNDYLGVVRDDLLKDKEASYRELKKGATGSRLISGNSVLGMAVEKKISDFHQAESGLIFGSGYDANLGLFSSLGLRGDTIIFDEYIHASVRDGIRLSFAHSVFFKHNDLEDLEKRLMQASGEKFVAVESIYSMDGDMVDAQGVVNLCKQYGAHLIVDEAHAIGVIGQRGEGLFQAYGLEGDCFARVYTFGKALGIHGAVVVGSEILKDYLVNHCRPFMYSTAPSERDFFMIEQAYEVMAFLEDRRRLLREHIDYFCSQQTFLKRVFSQSQIQGFYCDLQKIMPLMSYLNENGVNVVGIRHPSVGIGKERIRVCLHSFQTIGEIDYFFKVLNKFE